MKLNYLLCFMFSCIFCLNAWAQTNADTTVSTNLHEIVIHAPKVIHQADRDIYHPSETAVQYSKNGIQLLQNLMIPALSVNEDFGSIKANGQAVQLRINGKIVPMEQIYSLLPESIKRVEWIDNPGLQYHGANYVLNIIVVNPTLGGALMLQAKPALNQAWGQYMGNVTLNAGRSQWSVGSKFKLTEGIKAYRQYSETFKFNNGSTLIRTETPLGGHIDNTQGIMWMSYNYIIPDTTVVDITFQSNSNFSDKWMFNGLMTLSSEKGDVNLSETKGNVGTTPSLSAYLEQHLSNNQTFVLDLTASVYSGHSYSNYVEQSAGNKNILQDINTYITDLNQAYGLETNYIKKWAQSRFTAGFRLSANRNLSKYRNIDGGVYHQSQDKIYMFSEYFHRFNKITLTGGVGLQYTSFLFKETKQGNHSWNVRPQAAITYSPNTAHQFSVNLNSWQTAPSLHETNIAPLQLDGFQWMIGNTDLKTSTSYMLSFQYDFNASRLSSSAGVDVTSSANAIAPYLYWAGERLITTYENSKGFKELSFWYSPQIEIIPSWFLIAGNLEYATQRMNGNNYTLTNQCWSGNASARLMHWGFVLGFHYSKAKRNLWGEKLSWGEDISVIDLSYNLGKWQFGAGMLLPFGKYDQGSCSLSKWNKNEMHTRLKMRMPYISINYNIQWGRQKRGADKLINADSNVEHSVLKGR